jgi:hypothetical protein
MQTRTSLVHGTGVDEVYGLIHRGGLSSVLSVCVSRRSNATSVTAFSQRIFGPVESAERSLTEADWDRLKNLVERASFWEMPQSHERSGLDGFDWTIEGRNHEGYHSSECWSPDSGDFYELGSLLVELSGLEIPQDSP